MHARARGRACWANVGERHDKAHKEFGRFTDRNKRTTMRKPCFTRRLT
jgi:hypothetical protein